MRCGFCGGATVSPEVLLFFWILGVPIYQIYGMTESSGVAFMQRPGATRSGCSGLAVDGVVHRIADDNELLLSGPSVFNRDSPDDSRTGVNIGAFPAFLQDRRKVRTAIDTSRNRNGGRGADLLIFAGIRTHSSRRLLLSA